MTRRLRRTVTAATENVVPAGGEAELLGRALKRRGCNCDPDVERRPIAGSVYVLTVLHAHDCPALPDDHDHERTP